MAVLVAILAYVVLLPFIAIGLCVGAVLLLGKPKKVQPTPTPAPAPAPVQPLPDYIPRWNRARIIEDWKEQARFQQLLND